MRKVPMRAVGWRVDGSPKIHATPRAAYYEIAKQLVLAKYPPGLHDDRGLPFGRGWTNELADVRRAKAERLFFSDLYSEPASFNEKRWKRFLWRVVRFLRHVDKQRGIEAHVRELHVGLLPAEEHALLQAELERAERDAEKLMAQAAAIRSEIRRRSAAEESR